MSEKQNSTIVVICPCCSASLTIDPALSVVLNHKLPAKPQLIAELKNAAQFVKEEATRRDEKYQQLVGSGKEQIQGARSEISGAVQEGQRRAHHEAAERYRYRLGFQGLAVNLPALLF